MKNKFPTPTTTTKIAAAIIGVQVIYWITAFAAFHLTSSQTAIDPDKALFYLLNSLTIAFGISAALCWPLFFLKTRNLDKIQSGITLISREFDLSFTFDIPKRDELGTLASAVDAMILHIKNNFIIVRRSTQQLTDATVQLSQLAEDTNQAIFQEAMGFEQVATAITDITYSIQEVADNAKTTTIAAQQADEQSTLGLRKIKVAIESLNQLHTQGESAKNLITDLEQLGEGIGQVITLIQEVTDHTNLLALNAAIEAARAGEHGRGFGVVAGEVRSLANRTRTATEEIKKMISTLQIKTKSATTLIMHWTKLSNQAVEDTGEATHLLSGVVSSIASVSEMNKKIANTTDKQRATILGLNSNIADLQELIDRTTLSAGINSSTSKELAETSLKLQIMVRRFRVTPDDQRQFDRIPHKTPFKLTMDDGNTIQGNTSDISFGGAFLEADKHLPREYKDETAEFFIDTVIDGKNKVVKLPCIITHQKDKGIGICFESVDVDNTEMLYMLILNIKCTPDQDEVDQIMANANNL